jgi:signal transduction histidine kinase
MDRLIRLRRFMNTIDTSGNGHGTVVCDETPAFPGDDTPEFPGDDEVARLSRSIAGTMGRLEHALHRQRRFASDASHELRSPLAGLRARLEEAQLHPDDVCLEDVIDQALHDVDRLEQIVSDLLLLSRIEANGHTDGNGNGNGHGNGNGCRKVEAVDLAELVRSEVGRRRDRLTDELRLEPAVIVEGVQGELRRVLTNLMDNAQRHAERHVKVDVRRDGNCAELIVSDDGHGIAEADRERIFERFTRLAASRKRDHAGTGLGLAIARDIAHAHHGTLEVGDSPAGGARFVLRLPLTESLELLGH